MKEFLEIYEENRSKIEYFIQESIKNIGTLKNQEKSNYKKLFNIFPSLELVYLVNKNSKQQVSNNIFRYTMDKSEKSKDRSYLISKLHFKDTNIAFSPGNLWGLVSLFTGPSDSEGKTGHDFSGFFRISLKSIPMPGFCSTNFASSHSNS